MPKLSVSYPPKFRRQMVKLVRSGRTPQDLALDFQPSGQSILYWVRQAELEAGQQRDGGTTSAEREELSRLRRENHRLRQERYILAKAAALFATDKALSGSSNS